MDCIGCGARLSMDWQCAYCGQATHMGNHGSYKDSVATNGHTATLCRKQSATQPRLYNGEELSNTDVKHIVMQCLDDNYL